MTNFPVAQLRDFLTTVERRETPVPGKLYRQLGVKWWGLGAYERESIDGGLTRYRTLSRVREGDIIINKIWARNGAAAVVSAALAGCYVSGEFPTFLPDQDKLEPRWFHWYTKTRSFWKKCNEKSRGTSGKNRIRPEKFLDIEIPLPPREMQTHIVLKIERITERLAKANTLRQASITETESLMGSELSWILKSKEIEVLEEVADKIADINHAMPAAVDEGVKLVSPKDFTRQGIDFEHCKRISRADFETLKNKILPRRNDILLSRIGTIGEVRLVQTDEEFLPSYSIVTIRPNTSLVLPNYLCYALRSPNVLKQAYKGVRAIAMPDLGIRTIRNFRIPLFPMIKQQQIIHYLETVEQEVDRLRRLQDETSDELSLMLTSLLDSCFNGQLDLVGKPNCSECSN
jgi:type I restriction enzyme S subunit